MSKAEFLYQVGDATWPAAKFTNTGNWTIRKGAGGGQRVSSATANGPVTIPDITMAEEAMKALGQPLLFMIREGDEVLDAQLADRGYAIKDPVNLYTSPVATLAKIERHRLAAFPIWPPLAMISEIWIDSGIGVGRQAVMVRTTGAKTAILARQNDRAAGVAYVAIHKKTAMLHALEVVPEQRRQGVAVNIMGCAAAWAQDNGATTFSAICVRENRAANNLYTSLGMENVGQYHYRTKT